MSNKDEGKGTVDTVIVAENSMDYTALKKNFPDEDLFVSFIFTPVDMYTGKLYENFLDESELGNGYSDKPHSITLEEDGKKYDISWRQEKQQTDEKETMTIYVTHPIDYNGVGALVAGPIKEELKRVQFRNFVDEKGGFSGLTADDYCEYLPTSHVIDCRDSGEE